MNSQRGTHLGTITHDRSAILISEENHGYLNVRVSEMVFHLEIKKMDFYLRLQASDLNFKIENLKIVRIKCDQMPFLTQEC